METTSLKEATRVAETTGVLSEMNLEKKDDVISGTLTLQTGEETFITYRAYAKKLTKDGKENSIYKGLETVMNEYVSIAGAKDSDDVEPTVVYVKGQIAPSSFYSKTGELVESMQFASNFFNRAKGEDPEFGSTFEAEIYIKAIRPEVSTDEETRGEETGRIIVDGYLPLYNGAIEPISLIAPAEDGIADAVVDMFEAGQTVCFDGDIINTMHIETKTIERAIGKPKVKKTTTWKNEMIITGATDPYDEEKAYTKEVIQAALAARDEKLEAAKNKSNTEKPATKKPAASGRKLNW